MKEEITARHREGLGRRDKSKNAINLSHSLGGPLVPLFVAAQEEPNWLKPS